MANKKITELDSVTSPADTDLFETVQDVPTTPVNKKITWATIKTFLSDFFSGSFLPISGGSLSGPLSVSGSIDIDNVDVPTISSPDTLTNKTSIDLKIVQGLDTIASFGTLDITQASKLITYNSSSGGLIFVPPNSSVSFPIGTTIDFFQAGTGTLQLIPGVGVNIQTRLSLTTAGQFAVAHLKKIATDTWVAYGDL